MGPPPSPRRSRGFGAWLPVTDPYALAPDTHVRLRYDTAPLIGSTVIGYLRYRPLPGDGQLTLTGTGGHDAVLPWPDHLDRWASPEELRPRAASL